MHMKWLNHITLIYTSIKEYFTKKNSQTTISSIFYQKNFNKHARTYTWEKFVAKGMVNETRLIHETNMNSVNFNM